MATCNENNTVKRKPKLSSDEIMALLHAITEDRKYILGPFNAEVDTKSKKEAWQRVTGKVNAVNVSGCIRTVEKVQKRWNDLKFTAKQKVARYRHEKAKTGGGSNDIPTPTDIEFKVVSLLGVECVDGVPGSSEISFLNSLPHPSTFLPNASTDLSQFLQLQPEPEVERIAIDDSEPPMGRPVEMSTPSTSKARAGRKRKREDEEDIIKIQRDIRDQLVRMVQIMENVSNYVQNNSSSNN